jgi:hypothetical protein
MTVFFNVWRERERQREKERERLVILECKRKMTSLRGQASLAKMMSIGGKLTALACHPTKYVNKAE